MRYQLNISGIHHTTLQNHLYCGDGNESVAIALCGRLATNELTKLCVHEVIIIPNEECLVREPDFIHWTTERVIPTLQRAFEKGFSVLKIHSHPNGYNEFSQTDDASDNEFFPSVFGWVSDEGPHYSAVMLPDGEIFGRAFLADGGIKKLDRILIAGDTIRIYPASLKTVVSDCGSRTAQAFGDKTYTQLRNLKIGVIGCSGTGSPAIEQLARYEIGNIIIVDPDKIEFKNLNRILNSTYSDAESKQFKTEVAERSIHQMGLGTDVKTSQLNLFDSVELLLQLATCDILMGCVDSVDGRDLLNLLSTYYLIPYFDLGVKLEADGKGNISDISGSVHYVQPGRSSLLTRGIYTSDDLRAAHEMRRNPEQFAELVKHSYVKNINVDRPAVISINMMISCMAVNELLNRLHPFRSDSPSEYAVNSISITNNYFVAVNERDLEVDRSLVKLVGRGTVSPFLGLLELQRS